jgi:hypothetical protein
MKVYELKIIHSRGEGRREFATVNDKRTDTKFTDHCGKGKPLPNWHELELFFDKPKDPKADVMGFGLEFVFNQRACDLVGPILKGDGEILPVKMKGQPGQYYLYNCTRVIDVLDPKRSIWEYYKQTQSCYIEVPAFRKNRFGKAKLFKYPLRGMVGIYVVERTGDYRDGELKALVEHHGITGLRFDLLWSDKDGPARPRFIPDKDDPFEYRTFDGKPWIFKKTKPKNTARTRK